MKLWHLTRIGRTGYDMHGAFVIRALSSKAARNLAATEACDCYVDEGKKHLKRCDRTVWLSARLSTCTELISDGEEGVVIADFKAG